MGIPRSLKQAKASQLLSAFFFSLEPFLCTIPRIFQIEENSVTLFACTHPHYSDRHQLTLSFMLQGTHRMRSHCWEVWEELHKGQLFLLVETGPSVRSTHLQPVAALLVQRAAGCTGLWMHCRTGAEKSGWCWWMPGLGGNAQACFQRHCTLL